MRHLVRQHLRFFLLITAAAFAVRLLFLWKLRFVVGDSLIYGDIAKNWLLHGTLAMTDGADIVPTYIRLPGYAAFLTGIWRFTGVDHYLAAMIVQVFMDVGTCFLVAALAHKLASDRAALLAFLFYALNPFTANYVATPLTEVPAIFFATLALLCAVEALDRHPRTMGWWSGCGLAIGTSILLRPDGGLLLGAVPLYLLARFLRTGQGRVLAAGAIVTVLSLAPLVPWTVRNWRVFHRFEPLAPRYANNPGEYVAMGFIRWTKTWIVDYASVEDVYWHVPGELVDISALPPRAFYSEQERAETARLFEQYNADLKPLTPELDQQFERLAEQRIREKPLHYYLWLPLLRVADMWLRPRTEALPLDPHWWHFKSDPRDAAISAALGAINLALIVAALLAWVRRQVRYAMLFVIWVALRCALLATLENPETRYTLECFPIVCLLAAANARKVSSL